VHRNESILKNAAIQSAKFGISIGIIAYLVYRASLDDSFSKLLSGSKDWALLAAAGALCLGAVLLTILRWNLLVRALGIPLSVKDALRLGFLGYLLNFVSVSVGGDLFKAIFLVREFPGRRADAFASILVDRIVGLYAVFVLTAAGIVVTGQLNGPIREVRVIGYLALGATGLGAAGMLVLLLRGPSRNPWWAAIPYVGRPLDRLLAALAVYRTQRGVVLVSGVMSLAVHLGVTLSVYLVAAGLPGVPPSLGSHFLIVPLAILTGCLPLPMNGLGAFEAVVDFLYIRFAETQAQTASDGLVVALAYRVLTLVVGLVGVVYYLASRREVDEVLEESEDADEADDAPSPTLDSAAQSP
jgi:hypothetical protein